MYLCTRTNRDAKKDIRELFVPNLRALLAEWLPGGRYMRNGEYVVRNPIRGEKHAGSFSVHWRDDDRCGHWYDHATGEGGDFISLLIYLQNGVPTRREIIHALEKKRSH